MLVARAAQVSASKHAQASEARLDLKRRSVDFDPNKYGWARGADRLSSRRSIVSDQPATMLAKIRTGRRPRKRESAAEANV